MAVSLDTLPSNSINNIDTNFQRVETALQDAVSRSGNTPNQMNTDLDMNSNDILNVGNIETSSLTINGEDVSSLVDRAVEAAEDAEQSANEAAISAEQAHQSAEIASGIVSTFIIAENTFSTKSIAEAWTPIAAPDYIRIAGYYAAGDHGGGLYKKVVSEPSHTGKLSITLEGGGVVWFELAETIINPIMLGAKADGDGVGGGTNDHDALEATFATAAAIGAREVTGLRSSGLIYRVDDEVSYTVSNGGIGFTVSDMYLDYTNRQSDDCLVFSGGQDANSIAIVTDAVRGDESIEVNDASSLSIGDFFYIASGDDFWQTTVQWCETKRVVGISGNIVSLGGPLDYSYQASANAYIRKLYFLNNMTFRDLTINTTSELVGSRRSALKLHFCHDASLERVSSKGMKDRGIVFDSFTTKARADFCQVEDCDRDGTGYGILASSGVSDIRVTFLTAYRCRHATASGGSFLIRDYVVYDSISYESTGGFDCHPESDMCGWVRCKNFMSNDASDEDGYVYQGNRIIFQNNETYNANRYGILIQPLMTNAGSAPVLFDIDGFVAEGYDEGAFRFSSTTGLTVHNLTISRPIIRHIGTPSSSAISVNLTTGTNMQFLNILSPYIYTPSSTQRGVQIVASTSGRLLDGTIFGGFIRSGTTVPLIEVNSDSSASTTWMSVDGIHALIGGTYAVRGVNANTKFKTSNNGYRSQATGFSVYTSTGNSEVNNWAM